MTRLVLLSVALWLAASTAGASNFASLGYSEETTIVGPGPDACAEGTLIYHHDGSFENAYAWDHAGVVYPYYGCFGEAYDIGPGTVTCGAYWVTTVPPFFHDQGADCYVWEGGVVAGPGAVVYAVPGNVFSNVPDWPAIGENDVTLTVDVSGAFTIGYWGAWPSDWEGFLCAADENGPGGHPWTCIAPGIGYPSGWQHPSVIWPDAKALGIGVYFEQATPVESETWGTVKALFR
jgi:hypothetical protein